MTWSRLDDDLWTNEELASCSMEARLLFYVGWGYCGQARTDGKLTTRAVRVIAAAQGLDPSASGELADAGLWKRVEDGFEVPLYSQTNPTAEERDRVSQRRREAGRIGGLRSVETRRGQREATAQANASRQMDEANAQANAQANAMKQNGKHGTLRNDNDTSTDRSSRGLKSSLGSARDARVDAVLDAFGLTLSDANYEGMEKICYKPEFEGLDWAAIAEHAIDVVRAKGDEVRFPKRLLETFLLNEIKKSPNGRTMDAASIEERERLKWEAQANDPLVKAGHERLQRQKRERLAREQAERERMEAENREGTE